MQIVADIREEQLKARIVPLQVKLILLADLTVNSWQALFKALFSAGDRAADLLQLQTRGISRFPDRSDSCSIVSGPNVEVRSQERLCCQEGCNKLDRPVEGVGGGGVEL